MRRALLMAFATLLAAPASAAAQAGDVVARLDRATPVAAYGGTLAWSERDPQTDAFRLMIRRDGLTAPAPVAPRPLPFDVDLGPMPSDGVGAVYSRCAREVGAGGASDALYGRGRGCDIFLLDPDSGAERRIAGASARGSNEFWPTLWRGRVAFARTYDRKRDFPYLYTRSDAGPSQRLPGGARGECRRDERTGRPGRGASMSVTRPPDRPTGTRAVAAMR